MNPVSESKLLAELLEGMIDKGTDVSLPVRQTSPDNLDVAREKVLNHIEDIDRADAV